MKRVDINWEQQSYRTVIGRKINPRAADLVWDDTWDVIIPFRWLIDSTMAWAWNDPR